MIKAQEDLSCEEWLRDLGEKKIQRDLPLCTNIMGMEQR